MKKIHISYSTVIQRFKKYLKKTLYVFVTLYFSYRH